MDCQLSGSMAAGSDRCPLPAADADRRDAGGAGGKRRGTEEEEDGLAAWENWTSAAPLSPPGRFFFCRPLPLPTSAPYAKKRKKSVEQLRQPPRRCHCGPKMPLPGPLGMQARDRASSAENWWAGSSSRALERATCRNRGTANTFDLMIPSGSGCEEAAQGSCGTAGSPPPCPPEGACQELGIWGGAFQNGPCSGKSDFIERSVL